MSVSFYCLKAPSKIITPYEDEPDYKIEVYLEPFEEINLSNSNAKAILTAMGLLVPDDGIYGEWEVKDLPMIRQRLIALLNKPGKATEESYHSGNFYYNGRDDEYVERTCNRLLKLVVAAQEVGYNINFA
jgi:hypothetical protein